MSNLVPQQHIYRLQLVHPQPFINHHSPPKILKDSSDKDLVLLSASKPKVPSLIFFKRVGNRHSSSCKIALVHETSVSYKKKSLYLFKTKCCSLSLSLLFECLNYWSVVAQPTASQSPFFSLVTSPLCDHFSCGTRSCSCRILSALSCLVLMVVLGD